MPGPEDRARESARHIYPSWSRVNLDKPCLVCTAGYTAVFPLYVGYSTVVGQQHNKVITHQTKNNMKTVVFQSLAGLPV